VWVLNDDYEGSLWDLVRVTEPSSSDSNLMNDQNQSRHVVIQLPPSAGLTGRVEAISDIPNHSAGLSLGRSLTRSEQWKL
jgi:hypothetical protein